MSEPRVIIVGAGPVGLTLALRLAGAGIACTVLESAASLARDLRASTFHPPTLDMLEDTGITAELLAQGRECPTWQIRLHETGERAVFDLGVLRADTRHPYRLQCEQHRLCGALLERVVASPLVEMHWNTRATGIVAGAHDITVSAERSGNAWQVQGTLLVGADGARSVIREALGLEFEGSTYAEQTILATTTFPFHEHLEGLSNVNYVWFDGGTFSLLRLPDVWRCSLYPDAGESLEDAMHPEAMERKLQRIVPRLQRYDVLQSRAYRLHKRVVGRYRVGRVLLAGDAAHINSPSGGMGMNGGIHDAFELASTIAEAWRDLRDGALPPVLDRYERRRRPIAAEEILAQADRNRARMQERDAARRRRSLAELQAVAADPERSRAHLLKSSMIEGLRRAAQIA
jgi:2-polyprenyl-6-methoxyphenol hydroxylase-like FAD-dependent oxidoreductase